MLFLEKIGYPESSIVVVNQVNTFSEKIHNEKSGV